MPRHFRAKGVEPTPRSLRVDECGRVGDAAGRVVDEGATASAEETELRQG
jgi:hypothetical protein